MGKETKVLQAAEFLQLVDGLSNNFSLYSKYDFKYMHVGKFSKGWRIWLQLNEGPAETIIDLVTQKNQQRYFKTLDAAFKFLRTIGNFTWPHTIGVYSND